MADVLITFKVMPEEADTDIDTLIRDIRGIKAVKLNGLEKVPIAFGLVSLTSSFVTEDEDGGAEKIEAEIKKIPGVGSAEVVEVTRLL
ncbi:MAG: elongation factor 1-beta [Candidatus Hydrothermarchaeota archaeon]|nr:elongation factor 1-beta [Candidatus Hydrothermarchaeota archaeon]